jgi:hypothetical protein
MKISTLWMITKLTMVSLYTPIGFSLCLPIAFAPVAVWGYFIGGCSDLNRCFFNPLLDAYSDPKFFRLFMLMWMVGVVVVCSLAYKNLKPEIHEWFRKHK